MTEIVADMGSLEKTIKKAASSAEAERAAIRELVVAARARGEDLTGPDGLLKTLTKTVLETAGGLLPGHQPDVEVGWAMPAGDMTAR
jgi:putative transposase